MKKLSEKDRLKEEHKNAQLVEKHRLGSEFLHDYLKFFNSYSYKNEMYGRIALHVILGQRLKNVHYMSGKRKIDIRVHLLLIKPQGTGKGAGYGIIKDIAEALQLNFSSLTESTDAGLVGTTQYDPTSKETVVVNGLLYDSDIVGMEEASVLFDISTDFSKKNMTYMQIAMNPLADGSCHIQKQLGNHTISFDPHASFLLMTYPPDKLVDKLVKTGFIDRVIPVFENVTLEDRLEVIKKISENINISDDEQAKKEFDDIIERLKLIIKKYQKDNINVKIPKEVHEAVLAVIEDFSIEILTASPKARDKLEHFISRLYENLMKLSIHHALIDLRTVLNIGDVGYARLHYWKIWKNLIVVLESLLVITPYERAQRHRIIRDSLQEYDRQIKLKKFVKHKLWVRRTTMVENLQPRWDNCSVETADNCLQRLEKSNIVSTFTRISDLEKDKFFERRFFGNVAYLKKIRDIE